MKLKELPKTEEGTTIQEARVFFFAKRVVIACIIFWAIFPFISSSSAEAR